MIRYVSRHPVLAIMLMLLSPLLAWAIPLSEITQDTMAELTQAAEVGVAASPTSGGLTTAQMAALAALAIATGIGIAIEAMGAMGATVAITRGETAAVTQAIGTMVAAGGLAALGGYVAIGVIASGVVISLVAIGITATVVVPAMARALERSHSVSTNAPGQTGEQTDDMHQAIQNSLNPTGITNLQVSIDAHGTPTVTIGGRGLDLEGLNVPGQSNVSPTLSLEVTLNPVGTPNPVASDLVDVPGAMPDPGAINSPDCCADSPGIDGGSMGLMMAFNPNTTTDVPMIPTLVMLGFGGGLWLARRRMA